MKLDIVRAVEAAYAPAKDDHEWLSALLDSLAPLDQGSGMLGQIYTAVPIGPPRFDAMGCRGAITPDLLVDLGRVAQAYPELSQTMYAPSPPVCYATDRGGDGVLEAASHLYSAVNARDALGIIAADVGGRGVVLAIHLPPDKPRYRPSILRQLDRLAAHITSAIRLRDVVAAEATEAVLDPRGRALDATGPAQERSARETLGDAVRRMETARGKLRRTDPDEALSLWQGLVDGTWSLVDRHDADGKRFLLARRNEPGVKDPLALTARERFVLGYAAMGQQNKYIAYLLGIAAPKVSSLLASARRKLRIGSRAELIRHFAPLVERGTTQVRTEGGTR
jgi:DNA-binding CsgD family transcriptional regulator